MQDGNNENQPPEKPSGNNTTNSNIDFNGYKLYVSGKAIN